ATRSSSSRGTNPELRAQDLYWLRSNGLLLLRALIDPGADEADLLGGERLRGRSHGLQLSLRAGGGVGALRTTLRGTRLAGFGRHGRLGIKLRHRDHQLAGFALADLHNLSVLAALEHTIPAVETDAALGLLRPVTTDAGGLENRFDVGIEVHVRLGGGRRELADIDVGGHGAAREGGECS